MREIVLVHGWGGSVGKIKPLKDALEKLGWEVLVPKLPGFDKPFQGRAFDVDDYTDYIHKEATKHFGQQKYFVFGHSNGGRIAALMAVKYKDEVKALVLCSAAGISRASIYKRAFFYLLSKIGKVFFLVPQFAILWRMLLYKSVREHDYEKTSGLKRETFRNMIRFSIKPCLPQIRQLALVLWGEEDKMTPVKDGYYAVDKLKNAKLVTYPGVGHRLPYLEYRKLAKDITLWAKNI